ncbi:hypothetical protein NEUTE1DRAFT_116799 [Neurospora tetrasperma FGSC 2508]|uniref:Uncharacterized protein n=1 Tax=Neurospora tetrasperma (strain FGSC 2508 / ATCC MYA-4615 / P0657) TaxID=510951 RepID=F8MKI5_NEUT8|nr:uncharacterized protein NEUTE1DRAFT_116799 [Neurospora tetrasperma FGSC 2508]EGO57415.1 hypothetical protein NEUTE1DRAFT_116799 [Neurospora tetrasperma FGSC 2508]EGZ72328.1 hypothetical protein NEUTE2DRAFT_144808 [Neurospora tetrasperma FGSC 2509]
MTVMIELPLLEGLSTHHVFYDFPSLHVSSPLLFCRLLALCQYQSDRVHILHWHSTAITYYTIGVIKGVGDCGLLGWCGCREVKMEYRFFLASVLEYLTVYLFLYFFFCFFSPQLPRPNLSGLGILCNNVHAGREWSSQSFYYYAFMFSYSHQKCRLMA